MPLQGLLYSSAVSETTPAPRPRTVDERYQAFAAEYVIDHNGTRAAIAAGYSERTAESQASRLLTKAKVRKYVDHYESIRATRVGIRQDRVIEEIARLAMANSADFYSYNEATQRFYLDESKLLNPDGSLNRDKMAAIQEIREDTTGGNGDGERRLVLRTTIKLASKEKNLDMLMRHLGAYNDKVKLEGLETLPDLINKRWGAPPQSEATE